MLPIPTWLKTLCGSFPPVYKIEMPNPALSRCRRWRRRCRRRRCGLGSVHHGEAGEELVVGQRPVSVCVQGVHDRVDLVVGECAREHLRRRPTKEVVGHLKKECFGHPKGMKVLVMTLRVLVCFASSSGWTGENNISGVIRNWYALHATGFPHLVHFAHPKTKFVSVDSAISVQVERSVGSGQLARKEGAKRMKHTAQN